MYIVRRYRSFSPNDRRQVWAKFTKVPFFFSSPDRKHKYFTNESLNIWWFLAIITKSLPFLNLGITAGEVSAIKALKLLPWITQLGISVAMPLAGFVFLGVWLHRSIGWGQWTIWVGLVLGITGAFNGFRDSLRAMERLSKDRAPSEPPPTAFNSHD